MRNPNLTSCAARYSGSSAGCPAGKDRSCTATGYYSRGRNAAQAVRNADSETEQGV